MHAQVFGPLICFTTVTVTVLFPDTYSVTYVMIPTLRCWYIFISPICFSKVIVYFSYLWTLFSSPFPHFFLHSYFCVSKNFSWRFSSFCTSFKSQHPRLHFISWRLLSSFSLSYFVFENISLSLTKASTSWRGKTVSSIQVCFFLNFLPCVRCAQQDPFADL